MQIGMIGLGRMGANMARRLMKGGSECVVYDRNAGNVDALVNEARSVHRRWKMYQETQGAACCVDHAAFRHMGRDIDQTNNLKVWRCEPQFDP